MKVRVAFALVVALGVAGCSSASPGDFPVSASAAHSTSAASIAPSASLRTVSASGDVPRADFVLVEEEWGDLFASLGDEAVAFGRRVSHELPAAAFAQWSGVGGGDPVEFDEPAEIRALFNALASANLGGQPAAVQSDDCTAFWFVFADGTRFSVSFDSLSIMLVEDGRYVIHDIVAQEDFYRFADIAAASTLASNAQIESSLSPSQSSVAEPPPETVGGAYSSRSSLADAQTGDDSS